jgi:LCP family protein required for cell wall assembly
MSDAPGGPPEATPQYTKYRARPRLLPRRGGDEIADLRDRGGGRDDRGGAGDGAPRPRRRPTWGRVLGWVVLAAVGWVALSFVLFLVSAQIQAGKVSEETKQALDDAGYPLTSANNILVLGSDQREAGTKEPGADPDGPSRADSIMLLRVGGGHNARLSIARDTLVDIPGHGRQKINAAYALGGAPLAIETVRDYLGVEVNHVIEVKFEHFPKLINSLGGVTYDGPCVRSKINGGNRNGGYTLRLKKGRTHIDGDQALALARTRTNLCRPQENDLDRARRQQQLINSMKSKLTSPWGMFGVPNGAFYRLPLVGWNTPRTFRSDMGGLTLAGVFAATAVGGSANTQVLGTLDGNVPESVKDAAVRRFLRS